MITDKEQTTIKQLKIEIDRVLSPDWSGKPFFRNYKRSEEHLIQIQRLVLALKSCDFNEIPNQAVNEMRAALLQTYKDLEEARQYPSNNLQGEAISSKLETDWYKCWQVISGTIFFMQMFSGEASAGIQLRHITELRDQVQDVLKETKDKSDAKLAEIEGLVSDVRKIQSKGVIAAYAGNFAQEAEQHFDYAFRWAGLALIIGGAIYCYVDGPVSNVLNSLSGPPTFFAWTMQYGLHRLVIVSLLTYALVVAMRNFSANWHNRIVNRHRLNAFGAFEKFANAAKDQQTKDAVLLEATRAVFAPQTTGYLKGEAEPAHGNQIVEIIRSVTGNQH